MEKGTATRQVSDRATAPPSSGHTPPSTANPWMRLQQNVGNQAMSRLLRTGVVQAKLNVSQPGDADENEADRAAEQVVGRKGTAVLQRKCACGGTCSKCSNEDDERRVPRLQRSPLSSCLQRAAKDAQTQPETAAENDHQAPTLGLIVEDDAPIKSRGQMKKSAFFDLLESDICAAADAQLAASGRNTEGCPFIAKWIGFYRLQSSMHVERSLLKYAPEAADATTARDYVRAVRNRVLRAVAIWAKTGRVTGIPPGVGTTPPKGEHAEGKAASANSKEGGDNKKNEGFGTGLLRAISGAGRTQFKEREGTTAQPTDAESVRDQLGQGRMLDSSTRGRMESAFGSDFSSVRVHDDGGAWGLSSQLNARAFTVGNNVAFGAGEYKPGTPVGDALIAHELAHVVQQGAATQSNAPMLKGDSDYDALEADADVSAVGAVASLWAGAKGKVSDIGRNAGPSLRSGLRLQRCGGDKLASPDVSIKLTAPDVHDPKAVEQLNSIWQKLTPPQRADYEKRTTAKAATLDDFDSSINAYLAAQKQRDTESGERERLTVKLYGLESLYKQYKTWRVYKDSGISMPKDFKESFQNNLKGNGFTGGPPEFQKYVEDYLSAFQTETAKIGMDALAAYDSLLSKEAVRYQDDRNVQAMYDKLAPVRKEFAEVQKNEQTIQKALQSSPYREQLKNSQVPGIWGTTPPFPEEARRALEEGDRHVAKAKKATQDISGEFPILSEEHLPLNRRLSKAAMAQANPSRLKTILQDHIDARRGDVKKARETLINKSEKVFRLDNLLAASLERQSVDPKSIFGQIVQDHVSEVAIEELIKGILIGVFAFALGLVSMGTGTVAVAAAAGALTLSSYMLYSEYKEYESKSAAAGTGLTSDDPSLVWVVVSAVGVAVDLGVAVKAVKAISPLAKTLESSGDVAKFSEGLKALEAEGKIDAKIAQSVDRAAIARSKSGKAAENLSKVLRSRVYGFPGPFTDPDVYKELVRFAFYKTKELGYAFEQFVLEIRQARQVAKTADLTSEELLKLKNAYEQGKSIASEQELLKYTEAGKYTTKIKWGIHEGIDARPQGPGFWGRRMPQSNPRVDGFELKINPNNESYYLPHPDGGLVQFENLAGNAVQDGKLVMKPRSIYHVADMPQFATDKVLEEAGRQVAAADKAGLQVEWLVSEAKAETQLRNLFQSKGIKIVVKPFSE